MKKTGRKTELSAYLNSLASGYQSALDVAPALQESLRHLMLF